MEHILAKNIGLNKIIGSLLLATICFVVFLGNIKNIIKINSIIIPILIIFILLVGIYNLKYININQIGENIAVRSGLLWIVQAILYASYNLILVIPVLINLRPYLKNKKQLIIISLLTSILISIISILIFLLLINVNTNFSNLDMPVVYVIKNKFPEISKIYGVIILIAIFTTAISIGTGFLNNVSTCKREYISIAFLMCIISIIIANIGFSNLVKVLFPMFGYMGILQILLILF